HTGDADTPERMREKLAFLDAAAERLAALRAAGRHVVLTGDLNVGHREFDIKNWKGNLKKAGFLPEERTWFDRLFADGWALRLSEADCADALAVPGVTGFSPMPGRTMRGWALLPPEMVADDATLEPWVQRALDFAASLPSK
ncbi:MAG: endonuclease/exonuclease/phosphatase family protein, partial [Chloroflexota bacterium]